MCLNLRKWPEAKWRTKLRATAPLRSGDEAAEALVKLDDRASTHLANTIAPTVGVGERPGGGSDRWGAFIPLTQRGEGIDWCRHRDPIVSHVRA